MNVIIFGASGMVGTGALIECLDDPRVTAVLVIGRTSCNRTHAKLREIIRQDFFDYSDIRHELAGYRACFFCLGVTSAGMTEAKYHRLTHDLTLAAATALAEVNPGMTFCYVSGEGTDSTERGRIMWARVKGRTENRLLELPLDAYMFRPGYIQPLRGARSKTRLYRAAYTLLGAAYPLLQRIVPGRVTTTVAVGRALIEVAVSGHATRVVEVADINRLAGQR